MQTEATLMQLIPSERAVLGLIRMLFFEVSDRTMPVSLLMGRWPAPHADAYKGGYAGLVKKGLLATSADGRNFSITTLGLKAMARSR
jgi:hypothetical protein